MCFFPFRFFCSLLLFSVVHAIAAKEIAITEPPKNWECIQDPTQLPQKIKIIYIGPSSEQNSLNPSLNVACEGTNLKLEEYVNLAKTYHESQGRTRCTLLGKIKTQSGDAQLLQIDRISQWGDVRFMQAMMISDQEAYVVTATCLKKEFSRYAASLYKAIQSVKIDF